MAINFEDPIQCETFVREVLKDLPQRLTHTVAVANYARQTARAINEKHLMQINEDLCYCGGLLHDIGYAATLRKTGFHPIDGANFLREQGFSRLADMVQLHSSAMEESVALGIICPFPNETIYSSIVSFADLHISPTGNRVSLEERLAPILSSLAESHPIIQGLHKALPRLRQLDASIFGFLAP